MNELAVSWRAILVSLGWLLGPAAAALLVHQIVYSAAGRVAVRTSMILDDALVRHSRRSTRFVLPLFAVFATLPLAHLPAELLEGIRHFVGLCLIASVAWLLIDLVDVLEDVIAARYRMDVPDNLTQRRVQTQVLVLRRLLAMIITLVAVALMLMTFPTIRNLGASLLASAGVVGLVVGMAARSALSNLIAGLQIALTEPIRLDDVVIVEGEWGWIEEISTTYVVVRIWDQRRLVVPLSQFIEKPFQNWTRQTAQILGTAYVYADYTVPVEEVRQELRRILESSDLWDHEAWGLQVTNASEHTVELRALMSAADSGKAWDLRCLVREKLIDFLQRTHPETLPRMRAEVQSGAVQAG